MWFLNKSKSGSASLDMENSGSGSDASNGSGSGNGSRRRKSPSSQQSPQPTEEQMEHEIASMLQVGTQKDVLYAMFPPSIVDRVVQQQQQQSPSSPQQQQKSPKIGSEEKQSPQSQRSEESLSISEIMIGAQESDSGSRSQSDSHSGSHSDYSDDSRSYYSRSDRDEDSRSYYSRSDEEDSRSYYSRDDGSRSFYSDDDDSRFSEDNSHFSEEDSQFSSRSGSSRRRSDSSSRSRGSRRYGNDPMQVDVDDQANQVETNATRKTVRRLDEAQDGEELSPSEYSEDDIDSMSVEKLESSHHKRQSTGGSQRSMRSIRSNRRSVSGRSNRGSQRSMRSASSLRSRGMGNSSRGTFASDGGDSRYSGYSSKGSCSRYSYNDHSGSSSFAEDSIEDERSRSRSLSRSPRRRQQREGEDNRKYADPTTMVIGQQSSETDDSQSFYSDDSRRSFSGDSRSYYSDNSSYDSELSRERQDIERLLQLGTDMAVIEEMYTAERVAQVLDVQRKRADQVGNESSDLSGSSKSCGDRSSPLEDLGQPSAAADAGPEVEPSKRSNEESDGIISDSGEGSICRSKEEDKNHIGNHKVAVGTPQIEKPDKVETIRPMSPGKDDSADGVISTDVWADKDVPRPTTQEPMAMEITPNKTEIQAADVESTEKFEGASLSKAGYEPSVVSSDVDTSANLGAETGDEICETAANSPEIDCAKNDTMEPDNKNESSDRESNHSESQGTNELEQGSESEREGGSESNYNESKESIAQHLEPKSDNAEDDFFQNLDSVGDSVSGSNSSKNEFGVDSGEDEHDAPLPLSVEAERPSVDSFVAKPLRDVASKSSTMHSLAGNDFVEISHSSISYASSNASNSDLDLDAKVATSTETEYDHGAIESQSNKFREPAEQEGVLSGSEEGSSTDKADGHDSHERFELESDSASNAYESPDLDEDESRSNMSAEEEALEADDTDTLVERDSDSGSMHFSDNSVEGGFLSDSKEEGSTEKTKGHENNDRFAIESDSASNPFESSDESQSNTSVEEEALDDKHAETASDSGRSHSYDNSVKDSFLLEFEEGGMTEKTEGDFKNENSGKESDIAGNASKSSDEDSSQSNLSVEETALEVDNSNEQGRSSHSYDNSVEDEPQKMWSEEAGENSKKAIIDSSGSVGSSNRRPSDRKIDSSNEQSDPEEIYASDNSSRAETDYEIKDSNSNSNDASSRSSFVQDDNSVDLSSGDNETTADSPRASSDELSSSSDEASDSSRYHRTVDESSEQEQDCPVSEKEGSRLRDSAFPNDLSDEEGSSFDTGSDFGSDVVSTSSRSVRSGDGHTDKNDSFQNSELNGDSRYQSASEPESVPDDASQASSQSGESSAMKNEANLSPESEQEFFSELETQIVELESEVDKIESEIQGLLDVGTQVSVLEAMYSPEKVAMVLDRGRGEVDRTDSATEKDDRGGEDRGSKFTDKTNVEVHEKDETESFDNSSDAENSDESPESSVENTQNYSGNRLHSGVAHSSHNDRDRSGESGEESERSRSSLYSDNERSESKTIDEEASSSDVLAIHQLHEAGTEIEVLKAMFNSDLVDRVLAESPATKELRSASTSVQPKTESDTAGDVGTSTRGPFDYDSDVQGSSEESSRRSDDDNIDDRDVYNSKTRRQRSVGRSSFQDDEGDEQKEGDIQSDGTETRERSSFGSNDGRSISSYDSDSKSFGSDGKIGSLLSEDSDFEQVRTDIERLMKLGTELSVLEDMYSPEIVSRVLLRENEKFDESEGFSDGSVSESDYESEDDAKAQPFWNSPENNLSASSNVEGQDQKFAIPDESSIGLGVPSSGIENLEANDDHNFLRDNSSSNSELSQEKGKRGSYDGASDPSASQSEDLPISDEAENTIRNLFSAGTDRSILESMFSKADVALVIENMKPSSAESFSSHDDSRSNKDLSDSQADYNDDQSGHTFQSGPTSTVGTVNAEVNKETDVMILNLYHAGTDRAVLDSMFDPGRVALVLDGRGNDGGDSFSNSVSSQDEDEGIYFAPETGVPSRESKKMDEPDATIKTLHEAGTDRAVLESMFSPEDVKRVINGDTKAAKSFVQPSFEDSSEPEAKEGSNDSYEQPDFSNKEFASKTRKVTRLQKPTSFSDSESDPGSVETRSSDDSKVGNQKADLWDDSQSNVMASDSLSPQDELDVKIRNLHEAGTDRSLLESMFSVDDVKRAVGRAEEPAKMFLDSFSEASSESEPEVGSHESYEQPDFSNKKIDRKAKQLPKSTSLSDSESDPGSIESRRSDASKPGSQELDLLDNKLTSTMASDSLSPQDELDIKIRNLHEAGTDRSLLESMFSPHDVKRVIDGPGKLAKRFLDSFSEASSESESEKGSEDSYPQLHSSSKKVTRKAKKLQKPTSFFDSESVHSPSDPSINVSRPSSKLGTGNSAGDTGEGDGDAAKIASLYKAGTDMQVLESMFGQDVVKEALEMHREGVMDTFFDFGADPQWAESGFTSSSTIDVKVQGVVEAPSIAENDFDVTDWADPEVNGSLAFGQGHDSTTLDDESAATIKSLFEAGTDRSVLEGMFNVQHVAQVLDNDRRDPEDVYVESSITGVATNDQSGVGLNKEGISSAKEKAIVKKAEEKLYSKSSEHAVGTGINTPSQNDKPKTKRTRKIKKKKSNVSSEGSLQSESGSGSVSTRAKGRRRKGDKKAQGKSGKGKESGMQSSQVFRDGDIMFWLDQGTPVAIVESMYSPEDVARVMRARAGPNPTKKESLAGVEENPEIEEPKQVARGRTQKKSKRRGASPGTPENRNKNKSADSFSGRAATPTKKKRPLKDRPTTMTESEEDLTKVVEQLRRSLAESNEKNANLSQQLSEVKAENEKLSASLTETAPLKDQNNNLLQQNDRLQMQVSELQSAIFFYENASSSTESEPKSSPASNLSNERDEGARQVPADLAKENLELNKKLSKLEKKSLQNLKQLHKAAHQLNKISSEKLDLQKKFEALIATPNGKRAMAYEKLADARTESYKDLVKEANREIRMLSAKNESYSETISLLAAKGAESEKKLAAAKKDLQVVSKENQALAKGLDKSLRQQEQLQKKMVVLGKSWKKREKQLLEEIESDLEGRLREKASRFGESLQDAAAEIEILTVERNKMAAELEELRGTADDRRQLLLDVNERLRDAAVDNIELRGNCDETARKCDLLASAVDALQRTVRNKESEIGDLSENARLLKDDLRKAYEEIWNLEQERNELAERVRDLDISGGRYQTTLYETYDNLDAVVAEKNELSTRLRDALDECRELRAAKNLAEANLQTTEANIESFHNILNETKEEMEFISAENRALIENELYGRTKGKLAPTFYVGRQ